MSTEPESPQPAQAVTSMGKRMLPWPSCTAVLCLAFIPIVWLCLGSTADQSNFTSHFFALVYLLGLDPFFVRRNWQFNLTGLLLASFAGVVIAGTGWLFGSNLIVLVWFGMSGVLYGVAQPTSWGKMMAHQIELEKQSPNCPGNPLNTATQQSQRMLMVGDWMLVLFFGFVLWVVYHWFV